MFTIAYQRDDTVIIDGIEYNLDLTFDNVLRVFDMLQDIQLSEGCKLNTFFEMLIVGNSEKLLSLDKGAKQEAFSYVFREKIAKEKPAFMVYSEEKKDDKKLYSITEDADYIFSSFIKDYKLNLLELQGELHWLDFKVLLRDLSEETKFKKVIEIRNWKPSKHTDSKTKADMAKLKKMYALGVSQEEAEEIALFNAMSEVEKQEYARMKYEQAKLEGGEING